MLDGVGVPRMDMIVRVNRIKDAHGMNIDALLNRQTVICGIGCALTIRSVVRVFAEPMDCVDD